MTNSSSDSEDNNKNARARKDVSDKKTPSFTKDSTSKKLRDKSNKKIEKAESDDDSDDKDKSENTRGKKYASGQKTPSKNKKSSKKRGDSESYDASESEVKDKNKNTCTRKDTSIGKTPSITTDKKSNKKRGDSDSDEDSESDVKEFKKENEKLKKQIKSLQKERKEAEAMCEELEESLNSNAKKQAKEIKKLKKLITDKEEELEDLQMALKKERLNNCKTSNVDNEELEKWKTEIEELKKKYDKTIKELKNEKDELKIEIKDLEKSMEKYDDERQKNKENIQEINEKNEKLQKIITDEEEALEDLKKKYGDECLRNKEKKAAMLTMRDRIDAYKEDNLRMMNACKARENYIMKLIEENDKLNDEDSQSAPSSDPILCFKPLEKEIQKLKKQTKSLLKCKKEAEVKYEELDGSLNNNARKEAKEINSETANVDNDDLGKLKADHFTEYIQMKENYDKQIQDLKKENDEMIEEMATLNNNIQTLTAEKETKHYALMAMRDKIKVISTAYVSKEEYQRVMLALKARENDITKLNEEKRSKRRGIGIEDQRRTNGTKRNGQHDAIKFQKKNLQNYMIY